MIIIKEILKGLNFISAVCTFFYVLTGLCVLKNISKLKTSEIKKKFACIVPARNEEKVIGNLLDSLNSQKYSKELYDIFVLPNNCIDETEKIARQKNANIIDCSNLKIKSKGDVLRNAFDYLKPFNFDAYIIFDADNIVHPEFIEKMNDTLCSGYKLAQGYRDSKNPSDSWISSSYSLHYIVQNYFVNKARMNINQSSFINGTGFMISKELLENKGYQSSTMTEDIELSVKCAIDNEKIAFVEDAITYDEQPITFMQSWKQRKRWSVGTLQCLKLYFRELICGIVTQRRFSFFDTLLFLLAPVLQLMGTVIFCLNIGIKLIENESVDFSAKIILGIIWYIAYISMAALVVKANNKEVKKYIKGIITLPIFYLTWIPINVVALLKKDYKWEQIEHTRIIKLENIIKMNYISNGVKNEEG